MFSVVCIFHLRITSSSWHFKIQWSSQTLSISNSQEIFTSSYERIVTWCHFMSSYYQRRVILFWTSCLTCQTLNQVCIFHICSNICDILTRYLMAKAFDIRIYRRHLLLHKSERFFFSCRKRSNNKVTFICFSTTGGGFLFHIWWLFPDSEWSLAFSLGHFLRTCNTYVVNIFCGWVANSLVPLFRMFEESSTRMCNETFVPTQEHM